MKYVSIDEEGYFLSQGVRWADTSICRPLLQNLRSSKNGSYLTSHEATNTSDFYYVEFFDQPLVALNIESSKDFIWSLLAPYDFNTQFDVRRLCLDEWDRFIGWTTNEIPFVFSRAAQNQFFKSLQRFDDDSFTINNTVIVPPPWPVIEKNTEVQDWDQAYTKNQTGWDLGEFHPSLPSISAQLKLNKCRVLVLGCGEGHDAAYFAKQGHFVTAIDWSQEALQRANTRYSSVPHLTFLKADALKLPQKMEGKFDLVFDHTFYCAVPPTQRTPLVKAWKRALTDQGQLLGIFRICTKHGGPPYSVSEWELRQRLKKDFHFLYWTRARAVPPGHEGKDLIIFASILKSLA